MLTFNAHKLKGASSAAQLANMHTVLKHLKLIAVSKNSWMGIFTQKPVIKIICSFTEAVNVDQAAASCGGEHVVKGNREDPPGMSHMRLLEVFELSPLRRQIWSSDTEPSRLIILLWLGLTSS